MPLPDESLVGAPRRLRRAVERVEKEFRGSAVTAKGARAYARAMGLALDADPALAVALFASYDARIPGDLYAVAFEPEDRQTLRELTRREDRDTLSTVFELATRLRIEDLRAEALDRLAGVLGREGDANRLVTHLQRWQDLGLLEAATLGRALRGHLTRVSLDRDAPLWSAYLAQVPENLLPESFEVHCFLGHGAEAVRLADTSDRRAKALECCLASRRPADIEAGRELARSLGDEAAARTLSGHLADLLFAAGRYADALPAFQEAGLADRASACLERLGRVTEALTACPADRPDDLARLAGACRRELDERVENRDFLAAARQVQEIIGHLDRAVEATEAVTDRREEMSGLRTAILTAGRRHFRASARTDGDDDLAVLTEWSRFEEHAGEDGEAARLAEEAGDLYRAYRLYRRAERFGEADRVLRGEDTPEGRTARAEAREAGGDLVGAARLHQEDGRPDAATALFMRAGDFAAAAACLSEWLGEDAIEDPRLAECLRRTGDLEELARRCLRAVDRAGRGGRIADELRAVRDAGALSPSLQAEVSAALDALDLHGRRPFEERATVWVKRARADIDRRFAHIWGLDLGTTTSAAAIYDTEQGRPVLCPWRGHGQFPSTLSLDEDGNELVGLAGEEIFAGRLLGHIGSAKRKMGGKAVFRVRDRTYRPEEVAARLIHHARGMVEDLLAERVRERVADLARAELGEVRDSWLEWLRDNHDLRLARPRAILTIPAYFRNNQKHATRHACEIAGVEPVRLIHEPTAACMMAARERRLDGTVTVVDLGAGTLDVSLLEVGDGVHEVRRTMGDNAYGGNDFDGVVSRHLAEKLEGQGVTVPPSGLARRRLEVAAEYLKIALSGQEQAHYSLVHFVDGRDVTVELSRAELTRLLERPLRTLRDLCTTFAAETEGAPDHLVLVGGPMLSPPVRALVEQVFGRQRTVIQDPRSAVACGAALQAAMLDGKLTDMLLLDVTPLPMGLKVKGDDDRPEFSEVIAANTTIPTRAAESYTTTRDNQTEVEIEIFNGSVSAEAKVGQFRLVGIPPSPKGTPEIEVTFSIDESCVLEVTAQDTKTGNSNSVRISDTTLLSPRELDAMTRRRERQIEGEQVRRRLSELADEAELADPEALWQEFQSRFAAYRPQSVPPDEATQRVMLEIFNGSNDAGTELMLAGGPLRDLAAAARDHLRRPAADDDLDEARHLERRLREGLDRLAEHVGRVTRWNAVLKKLAGTETDPLHRFRNLHDTGAYARALEALDALPHPPEEPEDVERRLRCLAETGDADGYRAALLASAGRLGCAVLDADETGAFLARARRAFVSVTVTRADGARTVTGSGFLVGDRLVVTNRHWLDDPAAEHGLADPARIRVGMETGTNAVRRIALPDSPHLDVAVLRLDEPVEASPLRIGHGELVRVGDRVRAPGPAGDGSPALLDGVVDGFESFPEQGLRLYRTGLRIGPAGSGGPLLNALGEVVGVLTVGEESGPATFALTVDGLRSLLDGESAR
ncbi:Hsp70 family protein [Actinoallomurus iriomotensis]|uniref:Molecular chaperone DnaK n=1 Tax=Actinoallomurus iriomotensis TaxID=478107 RepID=A0A9W6W523_9ACTN|nr:Hsp70 family protein [Actinoallomurus iriomotensis]GLY91610.1 hypothetical protein Airi02_095380 [Actinoallomurus iriomotensis]